MVELSSVSDSDHGQSPVFMSDLEGISQQIWPIRITATDTSVLINTWNDSAASLTDAQSSMMLPGMGMLLIFVLSLYSDENFFF